MYKRQAAGLAKGATYKNPRTGKVVQRYVDFNQGLDALFLNEAKAKRLGEIALKPVSYTHLSMLKLIKKISSARYLDMHLMEKQL